MGKKEEVKYEILGHEEAPTAKGAKRGRKSKAEILASKEDPTALEAEIALDQRLAVVDQKFGDGQPYERDRIEVEVRTHLQNSAALYLQAGLRLVQLKEHEPHGTFMESIKRIGVTEDVCQRMMLVARKLQGTQISNSVATRNLLPTKLYEIALLDDDQLDELDQQGAVGQVTLDDIQRMTSREVRAALRTERKKREEEIEARERVIKEKNDKLDELDRELRGLPPKSRKEVNEAILRERRGEFARCMTDARTALEAAVDLLTKCQYLEEVDALQLNSLASEIRDAEYPMVGDPMEEIEELLNGLVPQEDPSALPLD